MSDTYASGDWRVKAGSEDQFIEAWMDFLQWTRKDHPGLIRAQLIRQDQDPKHFVSFTEWNDNEARAAWRGAPEWPVKMKACRDLCEQFSGLDYTSVVTI